MESPCGWSEPGQRPDFNEYTVVLEGRLKVETEKETIYVDKDQAIIAYAGEWVRYSTPDENGAKYLAVCVPAFTLETVHRDKENK
jgi:ethanolamine utilization protein EutQ (cupin superfamily)